MGGSLIPTPDQFSTYSFLIPTWHRWEIESILDQFVDLIDHNNYGIGRASGVLRSQTPLNLDLIWYSAINLAFVIVAVTVISSACVWNSCIDMLVLARGETDIIPITRVQRSYKRSTCDVYFYRFANYRSGKSYYLFSGIDKNSSADGELSITSLLMPYRNGQSLALKVAYLPNNRATYFIVGDWRVWIRWVISVFAMIGYPLLIMRFNHLMRVKDRKRG